MVTLTGKITDVTGRAPDSISSITVKAPSARVGGGSDIIVTSNAYVQFNEGTGTLTLSGLHAGLSWLYIEGDGWSDSIPLAVAEGFQLILEAVANASGIPGIADYVSMIRNSESHARLIARAAVDGEFGEVVRLAQTAATTAEQAATSADARATSAESKVDSYTPRVDALEAMGGLSPESPVDGQTANLLSQSETLTRAAASTVVRSVVYDVSPTGNLEGDKSAVIAAALAAKNAGRMEVKMAPGHYRLDGVTVDDIHDRYLVGDGVTVTPMSYVYPFRSAEMAARSVESVRENGRGAIAFEVDDSQDFHWTSLFPLTKELGVPFASAWHTRIAPWMKEAVRHGWEAVSHLPYDVDATSIPLAELEALADETLDQLEWATGTREGHGFIYPRHLRNYETDRVLSKRFNRGRAGNERMARSMDAPNPWGYQAFDIDGHFTGGVMSNELKDILNSVAANDSKMVFFSHWRDTPYAHEKVTGLREMIAYARNLGIAIKTPKQLFTRSQIMPDPYMQRDGWTQTVGTGGFDTTTAYHGDRSAKRVTEGNAHFQSGRVFVGARPGVFTILRVSTRVKTTGAEASSSTQGIMFALQPFSRDEHGQRESGQMTTFRPPIVAGPTIPAQEWERHRFTLALTPNIQVITPKWVIQNVTSGEINLDEFQIDVIDYIPELVLEGATSPADATGATWPSYFYVTDLRTLKYRLEPLDDFVGTPSINVSPDSFTVVSTDATDTNKRVRVIFSPHQDHMSKVWSAEGA